MKNIAVIVENRHQDMEWIYRNHLPFLPDWDVEHVKADIKSGHDYNRLLTSQGFWIGYSEYHRVLLFQHDSGLLRPMPKEFLKWDYVGSPWKAEAPWSRGDRKGGNGGLSIRNPRLMLAVLKKYTYNPSKANEDVFYVHKLDKVGGKIAPYGVCSEFACETEYKLGTVGYHAIDKHMSQQQVNEIMYQYEHIMS